LYPVFPKEIIFGHFENNLVHSEMKYDADYSLVCDFEILVYENNCGIMFNYYGLLLKW